MKMEYSVFKVAGREERWQPKFVRRGQIYINLSNVFAECVHFLISRIRESCREYFQLQFKPKFVCLRSMLAAKNVRYPNKKLYTKMRKFFSTFWRNGM
jgi:hypothetical protein